VKILRKLSGHVLFAGINYTFTFSRSCKLIFPF
jgi:hypothetical protein